MDAYAPSDVVQDVAQDRVVLNIPAIRALTQAGISPRAISVIARSPVEVQSLHLEAGAAEDLAATVRRDVLSEVLDVLGSIESLLVPGFGGVLITGDLFSHVSAVVEELREGGAITAALVRLGVPAGEAAALEHAVDEGQTLVVIHGTYDVRSARAALHLTNAGLRGP